MIAGLSWLGAVARTRISPLHDRWPRFGIVSPSAGHCGRQTYAGVESFVRILLVCMGNICRSPTAEGVLRHFLEQDGLSDRVRVDSAGTHGYHRGEPPDQRAQRAARKRGIELGRIRSRRVVAEDFANFDLILAMDRDNLEHLKQMRPDGSSAELGLFMRYADSRSNDEVPDPYYGGADGFEVVLDMIEDAARGLIGTLRAAKV